MKPNLLIIVVLAIVVAGGAWWGLSGGSTPTPDLAPAAGDNPIERGLVQSLLKLRAVKLDGTILNDPAFVGLRDFSTQIVTEPVGRDNPFAPLVRTVVVATSSQASPRR